MVFEYIAQLNPVLFHVLVILASLAILVKAADISVSGISDYARKLGLSEYIVGFVVVAFASSIPELITSLTGAMINDGGIIFGTILGSNIVELTLVLGTLAIVGKKVKVESKVMHGTKFLSFALLMLPLVLLWDSKVTRIDGLILVLTFFAYLYYLWKKEGEVGKLKEDIKFKKIWKNFLIFGGTLTAMLLSSRWLVFSSVSLSHEIGIPTYYIALIVIGIGASISDISVGVRSVLKGHSDVGFGNVIGSNIIKAVLFLGIIALIRPFTFDLAILTNVIIFTVLATAATLYFVRTKSLNWKEGIAMLIIYVLFITIEWFFGTAV
ncbi:sodium:calcium antiporter [Nanoarchaeota archaeon]